MDIGFEILMLVAFIMAICSMIYRFVREKSTHLITDRIVTITMGVGFTIGAVCKAFAVPVEWPVALYALGAMLSYTATVFSFSKKGAKEMDTNTGEETE